MKPTKQNNLSNKAVNPSSTDGAQIDTANKKHHLALFDHLPHRITPNFQESIGGDRTLHAATVKLANLFYSGIVQEDDDRVIALIVLFCTLVQDYTTPPKRSLREDLDKYVAKQVCFIFICSFFPSCYQYFSDNTCRCNVWWIHDLSAKVWGT